MTAPRHVAEQGQRPHAYDRRAGRDVWGPRRFSEPSDCVLTNGLLRVQVGPLGLPPHLSVWALQDELWSHYGFLHLDRPDSTREVLSAQVRVEDDEVVAHLEAEGAGSIFCRLRMGERMVRVTHGSPFGKAASRYIEWMGVPPHTLLSDASLMPGKFGRCLVDGYVRLQWPRLPSNEWATAFWWLPDAASATQEDSGLLSISGASGELARLRWLDDVFRFEAAGQQVEVSATWSAGAELLVAPRITPNGLSLSVGSSHESTAASIDLEPFTRLRYGVAGGWVPALAGDGEAGDGTAGGGKLAGGGIDNVLLLDSLTNAEVEDLTASTHPLGGLPSPESRLVLHVPFDSTISPLASSLENGLRHEVAEVGS